MQSSSWDKKVDPAFNKFIKTFLTIIEALKLPAYEGYIHVTKEDSHFKALEAESFPDFTEFYRNTNPMAILSETESLVGEKNIITAWKEVLEDFQKQQSIEERHKTILTMINMLEQESREFYLKGLMPPDSNPQIDPEQIMEVCRTTLSNVLALSFHYVLILSQPQEQNIEIKELPSKVVQYILFYAWNMVSLFVHEKTLPVLYAEAAKGNDDFLFKLIQIDKTLFDHDWVRERIRKAMYSGEREFFHALSDAIKDDPLKGRKMRLKEFLVLTLFWDMGLYRLSVPEIMKLFNDSGLTIPDDEVTFRKFYDRFKKTKSDQFPFPPQ